MRREHRIIAVNVAALLVAALAAAGAGIHFERDPHPVTAPRAPGKGAAVAAPRRAVPRPRPVYPPLRYLGVYVPSSPGSYSGMASFASLTGRRPNIAVYYSSWWEPFQATFAKQARAHGAMPMVQVEPHDVSLTKIADGGFDPYLRSYARDVQSFGSPVVFAFGHEMNADWYGWGYHHTSPATFVRAWRHVHDLFTATGARNVIWLWVVNVVGGGRVTTIRQWWPGDAYVTWAGIDGHYFNPSVRFAQLYGGTLGATRALTRKPVLIAEVGIAPDVPAQRITDVFAGARAHGLIGLVWFDVTGHNIRVRNYPGALSAFRHAVASYARLPRAPRPG